MTGRAQASGPAPTRRGLLRAGAQGLLLAAAPSLLSRSGAAAAAASGLRRIAQSRGLLFGSMVRGTTLGHDRAFAEMVARECSLFTCRVAHWSLVEPRRGAAEFGQVEADCAWAEAHAMRFHGHALLWHVEMPGWFAGLSNRTAAVGAVADHIRTTCRRFAGRVHSWDVVNEAIMADSDGLNGLRRTPLLAKIGPDYLDLAFRLARDSDPKARLVYNEFGVDLDLSAHRDKRRVLLSLLDGFAKRGTPIDMVGLQGHLTTESMRHFKEGVFAALLRDIADRGVEIMITELDVVDRGAPSDIRRRDAEVAAAYRNYLEVALANPAVKAVITWGLSDRDSWISDGRDPETHRSDGLKPRPLPFDADYRPKPAYAAIAEALERAPPR